MHKTEAQQTHEKIILSLLTDAKGDWVSGKLLTEQSHTTNLGARITSLGYQGWIIESDRGSSEALWSFYRLVGKGAPRGRSRLLLELPERPGGGVWTKAEAASLQTKMEEHLNALVQEMQPTCPIVALVEGASLSTDEFIDALVSLMGD